MGGIKDRQQQIKSGEVPHSSIFKQPETYAQITKTDFASVQHIAGKSAAVLYMAILNKQQQRREDKPHSSYFSHNPEKAAILKAYEDEYGEDKLFYFTQQDAQDFKIKNLYRTMRRLELLGFIRVVWRAPKYYTRQDGSTISARGSFLKTPRTIYALSDEWQDISGFILILDGKDKQDALKLILSKDEGG